MLFQRFPHIAFAAILLISSLATASASSVRVSWNASFESDIANYRLHYGTTAAPYGTTVDVGDTSATVKDLERGITYTFAVSAINTKGVEGGFSAPVSYTVGSPTVIPPAALANISSRALVGSGDNVMIGGFIIQGVIAKKVALRAIGPSLSAYGLEGAMNDPVLQVVNSKGVVVASNDDWNVPGEQVSALGFAPADNREAAVVVSLMPGSYTAIVSGKAGDGGIALVDLYDLDAAVGRVANISTRSRVKAGENVMIGGFIVGGVSDTQVLIRAVGPSLNSAGVADSLADPSLELYDSYGSLLATNDNWRSGQQVEIMATGSAPTDDREAAILATLPPGAYSGVIRGADGGTGVALIEVFALNE
ncbi:MAG: fibronectin type III domain-containing protein [Chthoniobacterales bacterium]